jgi:hypothetical protein
MRARSLAAALGGIAAGVALVAGIRALAPEGARTAVPPAWIDATGALVALAALVLSWWLRSPVARRRRPRRGVAVLLGSTIATLSVATYWGLGNDLIRYHTWEHFHYYLGAKYFPELSYSGIYACAAVAESERVGRDAMAGRRMRDLASDTVVSVDGALARPEDCRARFTPERWRAFGDDVMWFRAATGRVWDRMQQDHGFNPPPTWVLAWGPLTRIGPAGERTQAALALIDPLLLLAMWALVGWAFGPYVLMVALVAWGAQAPGAGTWTSGSPLRQDWLLCVVAAVCLAKRGWFGLAGAAIATAAALRIFPVFLLALPMLVIARRTWGRARLGRLDRRFLAGIALAAAFWLATTTAVLGAGSWRAFATHMAVHRSAPLANHVGLRALLSQSWGGRWTAVMRPEATDPYASWTEGRRATFAARRPLYVALALTSTLLAGMIGWRLRRLWVAMAASSVLVLVAVDVASYYCAFLLVLGLLAAASRAEGWLALGAIVVGRCANMLPLATANPDIRYTIQSAIVLAWAFASVLLLPAARSSGAGSTVRSKIFCA